MANNVKILIQEQNGVTTYTPNPAPANVGDLIFWSNDTPQAHWPMPKGGNRDAWLPYQIPGRAPGEVPATSDSLTLPKGTYPYVCANHPDEQGGSITVS
jgi:plastocyanin